AADGRAVQTGRAVGRRSLRLDHLRRWTSGDRHRRRGRQGRARRTLRRALEWSHPHTRRPEVSAGTDAGTGEQDAPPAARRRAIRRGDIYNLRPQNQIDCPGQLRPTVSSPRARGAADLSGYRRNPAWSVPGFEVRRNLATTFDRGRARLLFGRRRG